MASLVSSFSRHSPLQMLASARPLTYPWLSLLHHQADRADENLGRATPGAALHRITVGSAASLMEVFRAVTLGDLHGKITSFVDLGCGRGLVMAAALSSGYAWYAYGCDVDEAEVRWARQRWIEPMERRCPEYKAKAHVEEMNALDFEPSRDLLHRQTLSAAMDGIDPDTEVVWVYALWTDWGMPTIRRITRRLLLEQGAYWTVFACSAPSSGRTRPDLFRMAAEQVDPETDAVLGVDEALLETLTEAYEFVGQRQVRLSGSFQTHTVFFYRHRRIVPATVPPVPASPPTKSPLLEFQWL